MNKLTQSIVFVIWANAAFSISLLGATAAAQSTPAEEASAAIRLIDPPCASRAMAADLAAQGDTVVLSWLEPIETPSKKRRYALRVAPLNGTVWGEPRTITEGDNFFANWADFPSVIPGEGGVLLAHWLVRSETGAHAYDIELARSEDKGANWTKLGRLHADDTATEHGFVSLVPSADGFDAIWLDGRAMAVGKSMSLMTARVGTRPQGELVLDADVCTCCQTDAVATDRGLIAVYRDHAAGELRDISIVRRTDAGWTEPRTVHDDGWRIDGCPVNGPSVAYVAGHLAVAWFTAAQNRPRVLVAFSEDDGASFGAPIALDEENPLGRVAVVAFQSGAVVSWLGAGSRTSGVCLRRVTWDGKVGKTLDVGATGASRASGFPRMVRHGDRLVLVWRDTSTEPRLRAALVPLSTL